jgi:UDP-N-acetyl-D-glucosamine dehydrogenase
MDFRKAAAADVLIMCVPTPLNANREPDMTYIEKTAQAIGPYVRSGQLVILESSTYPGTTEEVVMPIIEKLSGLRAGVDFFLAFSPEREDPGNPNFNTATIPKVVGGYTKQCTEIACRLYEAAITRVVPVRGTREAELTKLLENIFRCVNIALVNELKLLCERMNIDIFEVINAAATKPFGFMPFYPGPGLGGHCIPIDPFYLTWKAREFEFQTKFIELAGEINTQMPYHVVERTMDALNDHAKSVKGANVLILGLAYKKNIDDLRESPSIRLIELFKQKGANVSYHDPYCPKMKEMRHQPKYMLEMESVPLEEAVAKADVVVIATDHDSIDYQQLVRDAKLVVDTRNACKNVTFGRDKVRTA